MNPDLARRLLLIHGGLLCGLGLVTFVVYAIDKRRAKRKHRRVAERTLHRLSWMGGVLGGWAGRHGLRHKTMKRAFAVKLTLATVLHAALAGALTWFALG